MINQLFKQLITLILFLSVTQLIAQSKWSFGGSASIDYSYRFYSNSNTSAMTQKLLDTVEVGNLGYNLGLKAKYAINGNWSIISGISYYVHSYKSKEIQLVFLDPGDPNIPNSYNYTYKSGFIQIPMLVSFYKGKKLKFGFTAGLLLNKALFVGRYRNLNFENYTETVYNNQYDISGTGKLFLSGLIGAGVSYQYKKFEFRAEPTAVSQVYTIDGLNELYLWNTGLNLSVFYNLETTKNKEKNDSSTK